MVEQDDQGQGRYHDTNDPEHPHEVVLTPAVARAALWAWLGPLLALSVIMGLLLLYWSILGSSRDPQREGQVIGTSGQSLSDPGHGQYSTQGGGDPSPQPKSTPQELKNRGAGSKDSGLSGVAP